MNEKNVVIVLSTYNGQKFLVEQIASLQSQSYPHWILLVRDDGSRDDTPNLLSHLARSDSRIHIVDVGGINLGVVASFSRLLECALEYDAEYFFLCDQDDVWIDSKLELFIAKFKSMESRLPSPTPILIHSDLTVVNDKLEEISPSFMRYQNICNVAHNPERVLLSQNFVTGCASAFNRNLLKLAVPMHGVVMHDWWLALLASVTGEIGYLDTPTIAYRQHGDNTVGAKRIRLWRMLYEIYSPQTSKIWQEKQQRLVESFKQANHLAERMRSKGVGSEDSLWTVESFAKLSQKGAISRIWRAMHILAVRKIGFLRNILFGIQLLLVRKTELRARKITDRGTMNIVFIAHYFPPLNSSGARRVLAFSKYLSRFGHRVTVVTTQKSNFDGSLTEPLPDYCRLIELGGRRTSSHESGINSEQAAMGRPWLGTILVNVRRGLTRVFGQLIDHRIFFALRFFVGWLPNDAVNAFKGADVLISTSPPWPMHLAAYFASKYFDKPWVADYRDQFSGHHVFQGSALSMKLESMLDNLLLHRATLVTVVSSPMAEYYQQFHQGVKTIENGFDAEVFDAMRSEMHKMVSIDKRSKIIRYVGTITKSTSVKDRIPNLLAAIKLLPSDERSRLRIQFYGDSGTLPQVVKSEYPELIECLEFKENVPHREALRLILSADALFFSGVSSNDSLSAKGVLTTKLFEYMAARRPIVADIAPETLAGQVIANSGLGLVCSTEPKVIASALQRFINGNYSLTPDTEFISTFSREAQAKRLEQMLRVLPAQSGTKKEDRLRKFKIFFNMFEPMSSSLKIQRCPSCGGHLMIRFARHPTAVRCLHCKASSITMALIEVLNSEIRDFKALSFYELSSRGEVVKHLSRAGVDLTVSEFFDDVPPGEWRDQIQCQDVQSLTYPSASFDVCTSTEVFEHVPEDMAGYREIRRVLKPGGLFVFTVPFFSGEKTVERARLTNGGIEYLAPPVYHGDAIRGSNQVLVYRDYGEDILDRLKAAGFSKSKIVTSEVHRYLGYGSYVFIARV